MAVSYTRWSYPGNKFEVDCYPGNLARASPPEELPGGFRVGDRVRFVGVGETFKPLFGGAGDRLTHGQVGTVTGGSTVGDEADHERVKVLFPGNNFGIDCIVHVLSREAPPPSPPAAGCSGDEEQGGRVVGLAGDGGTPVAWGGASGSGKHPAQSIAGSAASSDPRSQGAKRRARLLRAKETNYGEEAAALLAKDPDRQSMQDWSGRGLWPYGGI